MLYWWAIVHLFAFWQTNDRAKYGKLGGVARSSEVRANILDQGLELASLVGFGGLTIGALAKRVGMSKSGLYAHFASKQGLQLQLLDHAAEYLHQLVIAPAFAEPRGEARVEALVEKWLEWASGAVFPGGCVFVMASIEFDDLPCPQRERIVAIQRDWLDSLAHAAHGAVQDGTYRADLDCDRFAFEVYGLLLSHHVYRRLLDDLRAATWLREAFEALRYAARLRH